MSASERFIVDWSPEAELPGEPAELLRRLKGPRWVRIPGNDSRRCRAVVTLQHGNEPSGVVALLDFLRARRVPAVDLVIAVISVDAALIEPYFSHRSVPGRADQNRCFRAPFVGTEGAIAEELLQRLRSARPEAILDLHNTSGASPPYGVATRVGHPQQALVTLFSEHVIYTDLRLGTLTEATEDQCPSVTIECGGAGQSQAHETAARGLRRFAGAEELFRDHGRQAVVHHHPVRVELRPGARVAYAQAPAPGVDITLPPDIDRHNFTALPAGYPLGWLGPAGIDALRVRGSRATDRTGAFFATRGSQLLTASPLRPLMVTTRADIAVSDCLFYVVRLDDE